VYALGRPNGRIRSYLLEEWLPENQPHRLRPSSLALQVGAGPVRRLSCHHHRRACGHAAAVLSARDFIPSRSFRIGRRARLNAGSLSPDLPLGHVPTRANTTPSAKTHAATTSQAPSSRTCRQQQSNARSTLRHASVCGQMSPVQPDPLGMSKLPKLASSFPDAHAAWPRVWARPLTRRRATASTAITVGSRRAPHVGASA
jgi:hypothetical protein